MELLKRHVYPVGASVGEKDRIYRRALGYKCLGWFAYKRQGWEAVGGARTWGTGEAGGEAA